MKKITIIGGGPAGYAAALYANNFDLDVTLIESDVLGGTCLNRGCIPAKYWLHVAELNHFDRKFVRSVCRVLSAYLIDHHSCGRSGFGFLAWPRGHDPC